MRGLTNPVNPRISFSEEKTMEIETLIATVDQEDYSLAEKMNIQTDAIIGNQCARNSENVIFWNDHKILYANTTERGVGKNRNLVLSKANADIGVLADDDMRFVDDYPAIVRRAYGECPDADIIVFNLIEKRPKRYYNKKIKRIHWYNYARYGAARLAIRQKKVKDANIEFSLLFGGGAKYGSGEDTVFLKDCLHKGLKIYAVPYAIAEIDQDAASTWFHGYTKKFFADKGALYACLYPRFWPLFAIRYLIKYQSKYKKEISTVHALQSMLGGGREFSAEIKLENNCR